ncbi:uncharacterized protein [Diabrotica undecimpunctata]|uniref:uncharacterized protein isoform X2 n=1 Tax=Diabrotica undecimpunctata TaxID=50387 RepID=UPI003B63D2E0
MEFKVELKEAFVECSERYVGSLLYTSTNIALKNEPEDKSALEIKAEIKKEFDEDGQGYVESLLTKSLDHGDLELYISTNNIEAWEDDKSAIEIKTEIKKEFTQDYQRYIENQLTASHDIGYLNNEPDEDNSAFSQKKLLEMEIRRTLSGVNSGKATVLKAQIPVLYSTQ